MDREELISRLSRFPGNLRLDFSEDYLESCDTDQLRHVLMAALWRCELKGRE